MTKRRTKTKARSVKTVNNPVSLSSADICKIIRQCERSGVSSLTIEGLDIKLGEAVKKPIPFPRPAPEPAELPKAAEHEEIKKDAFDKDEILEQEAAELMVTDPEAYEALMVGPDVR